MNGRKAKEARRAARRLGAARAEAEGHAPVAVSYRDWSNPVYRNFAGVGEVARWRKAMRGLPCMLDSKCDRFYAQRIKKFRGVSA